MRSLNGPNQLQVNSPLRICFVAPFGLGQKTTVWARVLPLARVLVTHGHKVTILIPPWDTPADSGKVWNDAGVRIVNVALGGGLLGLLWRLLREIRQRRPDIVHIVKPRAHAGLVQWWLWHVCRLPRAQGFKLLLDIDDWEQAWSEINEYGWLISRFLAWQEEWGIRHTDGITAASVWLVDRARAYAPESPIHYLPNGVAKSAIEHATDSSYSTKEKTILYFSRMIEVQPSWLAKFVCALEEEEPNARLLIAGGGLNAERDRWFQAEFDMHRAKVRAGINSTSQMQVEWLGLIPSNEITDLYIRATCAIFPAEDVPLQQAKCSVRLATTLLNGVPVIASAVGQQAEYGAERAAVLIDHRGQICADPASFSNAVVAVLREPEQQRDLVAAAQARLLSEYNWQKLGDSLADFYVEMIKR